MRIRIFAAIFIVGTVAALTFGANGPLPTAGEALSTTNGQLHSVTNILNDGPDTLVTGTGGALTNHTLLVTVPEQWINGYTNVSIRLAAGYSTTVTRYWTLTITNLSGSDRTLEFSQVTNAWRFQGTYGTNAPNTLTNGTALVLSGKNRNTNNQVAYTYFKFP